MTHELDTASGVTTEPTETKAMVMSSVPGCPAHDVIADAAEIAASAINPGIRVAAVIVTYNRKDLLRESIQHLHDQTVSALLDVLVIDNASTDGTQEALCELIADQSIIYVNTGANLGGAGGFNYGMREGVERGYDYVWVMDDDCMPEPDALEELLVHADALGGDYGWLSSKVLWKDGSICAMNVQRQDLIHPIEDFSADLIPADLASFVSLFVPSAIIRRYGLPIADFFLWTDDWEFTRRISRELPCYVVPSSVVIHKSAQNIGAKVVDESGERLDRFRRLYRNDVVLYRDEGVRGFAYEAVRLSGHTLRILAKAPDHRLERLRSVWGGTRDGFAFHPEIEFPATMSANARHASATAPSDGQAPSSAGKDIRILEAFCEPISFGGEESFAINALSHMDRSGISVDFMTPYYCDNDAYRELIASWEGQLYACDLPFNPGGLRGAVREPLAQLLANERYDIVHIHSGSITAAANMAEVAKHAGAKVIVHAHRGSDSHSLKHQLAMAAGSLSLRRSVDRYLACSQLAAETLFPAPIARRQTQVIRNGIDVRAFAYDEDVRARMRDELGIAKDALVIGHVGRFGEEKNHAFLVQAFSRYREQHPDALLLLVGDGELIGDIKDLVAARGLDEAVIFAGTTDNVVPYYLAMDVFAFPSRFEGLGMVAIEAQASGLPVIASPAVPHDVDVTGRVRFVSTNDPELWAASFPGPELDRLSVQADPRLHAFDARETARELRAVYLELVG